MRLSGRLDAGWCGTVQDAVSAAVRAGEHRIRLDMAGVDYTSSAGLRVLMATFKQLRAIEGDFGIVNPSQPVLSILKLSGLAMLVKQNEGLTGTLSPRAVATSFASPHAAYETFDSGQSGPMRVQFLGGGDPFACSKTCESMEFPATSFAIGIGGLGPVGDRSLSQAGEFLAAGGTASFQPTDEARRPDFIVSEGDLVPTGYLLNGILGEGAFPLLVRFEANRAAHAVGLSELMSSMLEIAKAQTVAVVALLETAGLVGAALSRSPVLADAHSPMDFPAIRDWISYSGDRVARDSTVLLAGIASKAGVLGEHVRSHGNGIDAHLHAAVFPYRPLQKGHLELNRSVSSLFDGSSLLSLLHLLHDQRPIQGAGESEFYRGAIWVAEPGATGTEP